jgi:hypothetical protein
MVVKNIDVMETIAIEDLVRDIIRTLRVSIIDGIRIEELCTLIKKTFGIAKIYCYDIIEQIKIELDLYSPDKQHLYFVNA